MQIWNRHQFVRCLGAATGAACPLTIGANLQAQSSSDHLSHDHVHEKGATAPGISMSCALYRNGRPAAIFGAHPATGSFMVHISSARAWSSGNLSPRKR